MKFDAVYYEPDSLSYELGKQLKRSIYRFAVDYRSIVTIP